MTRHSRPLASSLIVCPVKPSIWKHLLNISSRKNLIIPSSKPLAAHVGPASGHTITESFNFGPSDGFFLATVPYIRATSASISPLVEFTSHAMWYSMKPCFPTPILCPHPHPPLFMINFCCHIRRSPTPRIHLIMRLVIRVTNLGLIFILILSHVIRLFLPCRSAHLQAMFRLARTTIESLAWGMQTRPRNRLGPRWILNQPLRLGHLLPLGLAAPHPQLRPMIRRLLHLALPRRRVMKHHRLRRRIAMPLASATIPGVPRLLLMAPFPTVLPVDGTKPPWLLQSLARTWRPPLIRTGAAPWMRSIRLSWIIAPGT